MNVAAASAMDAKKTLDSGKSRLLSLERCKTCRKPIRPRECKLSSELLKGDVQRILSEST